MIPVREIVLDDVIQDLWGAGYTIISRRMLHPDPFHVPELMIPQGRAYQWMHLVHDKVMFEGRGWAPVPASRHDGYFMPAGHVGDVEVNGLGLFEKPKFEVDQDRAAQIAAANQPLLDWAANNAEFTGGARVVSFGDAEAAVTEISAGEISKHVEKINIDRTKTVELVSEVPRDMVPHISQIFRERDRLKVELLEKDGRTLKPGPVVDQFFGTIEANPALPWWPTLHAILLPTAIDNVRKNLGISTPMLDKLKDLKKETDHD